MVGYISVKKIFENCNSVGARAQNIGKVVSFWLNFEPKLPIFGELKKGKLYVLKKVRLSTFQEMLYIFFFFLKGYSETLMESKRRRTLLLFIGVSPKNTVNKNKK